MIPIQLLKTAIVRSNRPTMPSVLSSFLPSVLLNDGTIPSEFLDLFSVDEAGNLKLINELFEVTDWYNETVTIDDTATIDETLVIAESAEFFHMFDKLIPEAARANFQWLPNGDIRCLSVTEGQGLFQINYETGALLVESFEEGAVI